MYTQPSKCGVEAHLYGIEAEVHIMRANCSSSVRGSCVSHVGSQQVCRLWFQLPNTSTGPAKQQDATKQ